MKICNLKSFITGVFCIILALICLGVLVFKEFNIRYIISTILLIALASISFVSSFKKGGIETEIIENADERDLFIAMKSGHITIKWLNQILFAVSIILILIYGITKNSVFIVSAITICAIIVLIFIIFLSVNLYYERHE